MGARSRSKIVLIVVGSVCGLLLVAVLGGYWALRHYRGDLRAVGMAVDAEAADFAKGHGSRDCITEALDRETRDGTFMGGVKARHFLKACLQKTTRPAGFCDGVPSHGEIMAEATWLVEACTRYGKPGDETCGRTLQSMVEVCSGK